MFDGKFMRILYSPLHYFGGKDFGSEMIAAWQIFTGIRNKNIETTAVCSDLFTQRRRGIKIFFRNRIKKPYYYNFLQNTGFVIFYTVQAMRLMRNNKYDIIHHVFPFRFGRTFNPLFFFLNRGIKKVIGPIQMPIIIGEEKRGIGLKRLMSNLINPVFAMLSQATLKRADKIIVMNTRASTELKKWGIGKDKVMVIPLGVDGERFHRTSLVNKPKELVMVAVGSLVKRKGMHMAIKILAKVVKNYPEAKLIIIGDGPEMENLKNLANSLKVIRKVDFVGHINFQNLPDFYRKANIFLSMSLAESWGQVYVEAMISGLPVIASKTVGASEIVLDGQTGFLVRQKHWQEAAEIILKLFKDRERLLIMSQEAQRVAINKYDWEKAVIPAYKQVYNRLVAENNV